MARTGTGGRGRSRGTALTAAAWPQRGPAVAGAGRTGTFLTVASTAGTAQSHLHPDPHPGSESPSEKHIIGGHFKL